MEFEKIFEGVYKIGGKLATKNLVPGSKVYGEELVEYGGVEYRLWNPYRSKLSAAIINNMKSFNIKENDRVLYLGGATGTTSSHISDIIGLGGALFAVEISERNMRQLIEVCSMRKNMVPLLADARDISTYASIVRKCDILYQDVSSKEQASILNANSALLKQGGYAYFAIKSQSIDVSKNPETIFHETLSEVSEKFKIIEKIKIEPFDKMHLFVVLQKR
ncbi:MAG: fibrillarin-like rRNA/tRNA 2'-O-methyltransferase [Candidatus Micrarchaeia archaeon]